MRAPKESSRGFSLLEMMIALLLGAMVIGIAAKGYSDAVNGSFVTQQRSEMQQDFRAATNIMLKDVSLAGAGIPSGGVALPSGAGVKPVYGCDQAGKCYLGPLNNNAVAYPLQGGVPYLFGIVPGYQQGITINAAQGPSDIITIIYSDNVFLLNCYGVNFADNTGTSVNFILPSPLPATCVVPPPLAAPQNVTDTAVGLTAGDLLLFQGKNAAGNTAYSVAEVSSASGTASPYNVTFTNADALLMNQTAATNNNLVQLDTKFGGGTALPNTTASRIYVITYYLDISPSDGVTPRLMRQVNGHTPVPVAENVAFLQFTYDTYDSNGNLLKEQGDGGEAAGVSPSLIRKINIAHLTMRSQLAGTKGYQGMDLQTSVSARNLSFQNRYQ
jgi:prepilin-type N-terminal cleavage/methylation domain-containing protein